MVTEEQVRKGLGVVLVPGANRSVVALNLVRGITISDGKVKIVLASTGLMPGGQEDWVQSQAREAIQKLSEVKGVTVEYNDAKAKELNKINYIFAVMSGKGGVGKSLISSLVAIAQKCKGYEVGILDADITGPSIPKMFGLKVPPSGNESALLPVLTKSSIEVMSINLLLANEDDAVIWRGPLIGNTIKQFGEEVL
jgi:Mrp family chromosome partitioning ATPase